MVSVLFALRIYCVINILVAEISEGVLVTPNDDREICVNCTIPADVSATECVVITHPVGSLNEIKTFPVLNGAVGCEPVPTSQMYYVATFGRHDDRIVSLTKQQSKFFYSYCEIVSICVQVRIHCERCSIWYGPSPVLCLAPTDNVPNGGGASVIIAVPGEHCCVLN